MVLTLGGGGDEEVKQGIAASRGAEASAQVSGLGSGLADGKGLGEGKPVTMEKPETKKEKIKLVNKAGESRSPYVSLYSYIPSTPGWICHEYLGEILTLTFHSK